jgi:hypothetical protein
MDTKENKIGRNFFLRRHVNQFCSTLSHLSCWLISFLPLFQANIILTADGLHCHNAHEGITWLPAGNAKPSFFSQELRKAQDKHLITKGMPFLYELIKSRLSKENHTNSNTTSPKNDNEDTNSMVDFEESEELDVNKGTRAERRAHLVNVQYSVFCFLLCMVNFNISGPF